jgi:dihydrolipoamide dehydrogenase
MAEITLAIRAQVPVKKVADVFHAFRACGEVLEAPPRELAGTRNCQRAGNKREVER